MGSPIAELFKNNPDIERFGSAVRELGGAFPFASEDMIELGRAYFEVYPETFSNRDADHVQIGYRIVRLCAAEKVAAALPAGPGAAFRRMFFDLPSIESEVKRLVEAEGFEAVTGYCEAAAAALDGVKREIDGIPKGMIKERFVGGITNLFNVMYLVKLSTGKHKPA